MLNALECICKVVYIEDLAEGKEGQQGVRKISVGHVWGGLGTAGHSSAASGN